MFQYVLEHYRPLKPFILQSENLSEPMPPSLKTHINVVLSTLQRLLETKQEKEVLVEYNETQYLLYGFHRKASYFGNDLTRSGHIFSEFLEAFVEKGVELSEQVDRLFVLHNLEMASRQENMSVVRSQALAIAQLEDKVALRADEKDALDKENHSLLGTIDSLTKKALAFELQNKAQEKEAERLRVLVSNQPSPEIIGMLEKKVDTLVYDAETLREDNKQLLQRVEQLLADNMRLRKQVKEGLEESAALKSEDQSLHRAAQKKPPVKGPKVCKKNSVSQGKISYGIFGNVLSPNKWDNSMRPYFPSENVLLNRNILFSAPATSKHRPRRKPQNSHQQSDSLLNNMI